MYSNPVEIHIPIESVDGGPVDYLTDQSGLSRGRIKQAMLKGAVWLSRAHSGKAVSTRRLRRATKDLLSGDELHLYYDERVLAVKPAEPTLISDMGIYSVWYKPYGLLAQGSKWGDHCTLSRWAETYLLPQRPSFVVHRLDRAATGLMLLAHSKQVAVNLSQQFQRQQVAKRYCAIVEGSFLESKVTLDGDLHGKKAVTHAQAKIVDAQANRSALDVTIETGRKHQIRLHLSQCGFPIVGDRLYGSSAAMPDLQLTAYQLEFHCPVKEGPVKYTTRMGLEQLIINPGIFRD